MQNYLAHHGIKDQKWYVRRFQNEDGSLTPAGKERYGEWHPGKRKKTTLKEIRNKDGSYRYNIESEDGSKVGNISTYHQSDDSLRVSWISVDKNHKREGYASGAMDTLFDQAKEKGYKKVTVVIPKDDANVQHIYERLGFKPSNDGLTNDEVADSITSLGEVVKMEYELEHSDTLDDVLDDYLMHYGVGPDDNPPGRGSGRYAKGSGERPYQHDENKDRGEKKKGLFSALGAIHKALNPGFSAVDKAAEEAGRKLKEKEKAAKKEKEQEEAKKTVEQTSENPSELNDAKTIMSDMEDFFKKYRERPDHDVSKEREEIFDKIENNWLSTSSGSREMRERMRTDPEFKKRVISACDLGLKGLDEMNGPGYVDWDAYKERPGNQREWFAIEDQTIGMLPIADLINRGYTGEQVGKLIDFIDEEGGELRVKENRPGYGCYFDVTEGWADELKPFARACERAKNKEINHSDLLDDFLAHYGVGPDDDPPGRGSGRYAKGTGANPYQHDDTMRAQMKKRGLFGSIQTALAKRKANTDAKTLVDQSEKELLSKYKSWHKAASKSGSEDSPEAQKARKAYEDAVTNAVKRLKPNAEDYEIHDVSAAMKKLVADSFEKNRLEEHNRRVENLNKARETKAANKAKAEEEKKSKEERDAAKAKAIASGDPEQISKWLTEMSNQEQIDAINRIKNTQDIKDRAATQVKAREDAAKAEEARRKAEEEANRPKTKKELRAEKLEAGFEKAKDVMNKVDDVRQMAEKGIKFWNVIAAVNNATNSDFKLPKVDLNSGEKKKDKDKEENKENKNKNQQSNSGATNNTTYNTTNNYYNGEKKEETKTEAEAPKRTSNEAEDWYTPAQSIARKLLTSTAESRKEAAEAGTNYWKSISDWANDPSTERESNAAYNRDRANENARYNEWEANEQKNAAQRIANEERARREAAERHESESASREARLKREAQQYKFAQTAYEEKIKARDLDREHNNGDNWRHHDEQVKEAREKLDEISKDYNLFRKYL